MPKASKNEIELRKPEEPLTYRPPENSTSKGRETVDTILSAAEELLITVGYAKFTARKVADAAGIALGNFTYHFPTKTYLQQALVDYVLGRYLQRWEAFRKQSEGGTPPSTSIGEIMTWLIGDAVSTRTSKLFRELWAMASQSKAAAASMDEFYRQTVGAAATVVRLLFPKVSAVEATQLAYLMASISEGTIALFGTLPQASQYVPAVQRLSTIALESLMQARGKAPAPRRVSRPGRKPKKAPRRPLP